MQESASIGLFRAAAWVAFLFSLPPFLNLGIIKLPLPAILTYHVFPAFRAYARFGMVVSLCVCVLAGFGLKYVLARSEKKGLRFLLFTAAFVLILFEYTNVPPWRTTDITRTPPVYAWLADQPGDIIVAEYPMAKAVSGEAQTNYNYLYYQTIHHKRLVNGSQPGTPAYDMKLSIFNVDDFNTAVQLRSLGARYVILHTDLYEAGYADSNNVIGQTPRIENTGGYRLIKTFDKDLVYEITASLTKDIP